MKYFFLLISGLLLLLLSAVTPPKFFEGEIDYDISYESHQKSVDVTNLQLMMGVKEQFFISGGSYKSMTDGQVIEMQLYDPAANRLYTKLTGADTVIYFDAGLNPDSITAFSTRANADTILGHPCQSLSFTSRAGSATYFFSSDFPLDAGRFRGHQLTNWAFFCNKAHAVPLKMIVSNAEWTMTAVASQVRPMRLDSSFFAVPPGIRLAASYRTGP